MKTKYLVLIFIISLFISKLFAEENRGRNNPGTAFFLEMGGKWFYSANVDLPVNKSHRYSMRISPVYGDVVPTIMYYNLRGPKSRFEIGGGIGYVIILTDEKHEDFKGVTLHGVVGYRFQKKNGLLFRIGFTPLVFSDKIYPFVGLSLGYSL